MIEITPDYCVNFEGKYLVRTESTISNTTHKSVHFLQARVSRHFDDKKKKFVMKIDVNNQIPTHISKNPVI